MNTDLVNKELFAFLDHSPNAFFAVHNICNVLKRVGMVRLYEGAPWKLEAGKGYYVTRNDSSIIAFRIPRADYTGFQIMASHCDSPVFKIKTNAELTAEEAEEAAIKEQARQGTPDRAIPKVKIKKPKAAKKAVTVKWKKLSKKQLKKSKVTGYEIWVCPNKAFGPNDTVIKTAGKKKASLKVKGLNKGTYYVKVRAIRYDNNIKIVGKWSTVRKVRIRK